MTNLTISKIQTPELALERNAKLAEAILTDNKLKKSVLQAIVSGEPNITAESYVDGIGGLSNKLNEIRLLKAKIALDIKNILWKELGGTGKIEFASDDTRLPALIQLATGKIDTETSKKINDKLTEFIEKNQELSDQLNQAINTRSQSVGQASFKVVPL